MNKPLDLPSIRNITISGRIGSGATTLAHGLCQVLGWKMVNGGELMRKINQQVGASVVETDKRPDSFDLAYEQRIKKILRQESHFIVQSHLAGFDAQGISGVFKIVLICEDSNGNDKQEIRIDRLVNRDGVSIEQAKYEIVEREARNLEKWSRLYGGGNPQWIYWDKKYYDLAVNTYNHNQEETLNLTLAGLGIK